MDKLNTYREIVKNTILKYAQFRPSHGQIELHPVFDEQRDHYALMQVGWDGGKRI
ncbi:MAG TPA: element excision factor XisI family protein, partial [Allocoleopsis sp.]